MSYPVIGYKINPKVLFPGYNEFGQENFFVFPFDLNVEHGKIKEPKNPMVRFATPVFKKNGGKSGIIIINFLGRYILEDLVKLDEDITGNILLLNKGGFYLHSINPVEEFGFMFPEKKDVIFANDYPMAWQKISA